LDDETGAVRWQRQLGMVCRDVPLMLAAAPDDPAPLLLAIDQSGALFTFDPLHYATRTPGLSQGTSDKVLLRGGVDHNPAVPPLLVPGPDGRSAYAIVSPGRGTKVWVRHVWRDAGE